MKSGKIVAKQVFRGKLLSESKVVSSSYTPDWALVPKVSTNHGPWGCISSSINDPETDVQNSNMRFQDVDVKIEFQYCSRSPSNLKQHAALLVR